MKERRIYVRLWLGSGLVWPHPGDGLSNNSSFFKREEYRFGVQRQPGRGGLF